MTTARKFGRALLALTSLGCLWAGAAAAPATDEQVRDVASEVLGWLTSDDRSFPDRVLPTRGTVEVDFRELADARGSVGPRQAATLLGDVRSAGLDLRPETIAIDVEHPTWALVRATVRRRATGADIGLVLTFRREEDRWILREIREIAR